MPVYKIRRSWWVGFCFDRVRYRKRSPLNTRQGAQDYEATLRQKLARGEPLSPRKEYSNEITFREFAQTWLKLYVKTNNRLSEQRSKNYKLNRHILPFFGELPLGDLDELRVENYKAKKLHEGLSPKSINNLLTIINTCLRHAAAWKRITQCPKIRWLRVRPPKMSFFGFEETRRLLASAEQEILWGPMILCAVRTGLRFGELIGLRWEDVNWEQGSINVVRSVVCGVEDSPKNNRTRAVPMSQDLAASFRNRARPSGRVFLLSNNQAPDYYSARQALQRICDRAGLPRVGWHCLRHTFASHLVMRAVPLKVVQELLGHSSIEMTLRYSHLELDTLKEAVSKLS